MSAFDQHYRDILRIIFKQRRKKLLIHLARGFLTVAGFFFLVLLAAAVLDMALHFDPPLRTGFMVAILGGTAVLFGFQIARPLLEYGLRRGRFAVEQIALEIGGQFDELRDDLVNSIQVYHATRKNLEHYSLDLAAHALKSILHLLQGLQFSRLYPPRLLHPAGRVFISPLLLAVVFLGIFPGAFRQSLHHMLHPNTQFKPTPVRKIIVLPGDLTKVEGDSCEIFVTIEGSYTGAVILSLREESREIPEQKVLLPDSQNVYHHRLNHLRVTVHYSVQAQEKSSREYTIAVEKRPFVRKLKLRLDYPAYTELPSRYQEENVGDVTTLIGTQVRLQVYTNKILQHAQLLFGSGRIIPLKISGDRARVAFRVKKNDTYKIELEDQFGYQNLNPIEYMIRALEDQYPVVDITLPGKDVDLSEEMKLPLTIEAEDDFGFSRLRIGYRIQPGLPIPGEPDTTYRYLQLSSEMKQDTRLTVDYLWDLLGLKMMPEDVLYYFAEVWDNDQISGPKRSLSRVYTARFPSVYEIFEETARGDLENIEKMEQALAESKELKEKLDEITRELTQQQKMDWLKKQDIEEINQQQQKIQKSVEEVRQELEKMVERLEANEMLSVQTLKKFQELQKLFQEIMTPELQKALEKLKKAAQELNESQLKQALNQIQISQENLLKNLERTIHLLKRLQLEQRIDQATKLTENLAERQRMLNRQLRDSNPQDLANMIHQQQKISRDAQDLDQLLSQLDQDLLQEAQFHSETTDSLLQEIQKAMQAMHGAQQNLQQGKMSQAAHAGELSEQQLQTMLQQLQQLKQNFLRNQKQQFMQEFSHASSELLKLSQAQEELMQQTGKLSPASSQMEQVAENQQQQLQHLGHITDQLYQLAQQTFFVSPEIGRSVGKAVTGMQRALQRLEQRNSRGATGQQAVALGGLNEAILHIQEAMQNLQGSSSAVGFEEFMRRLQQMAGRQQGINQQTLQLGSQSGEMSLAQQAAMARLAAEQEALRKSLEQLRREFGNRSEITGRLEGITKEMEKVVDDLQRRKVSPRTLDRQKRILSRLLDAQRSLHRRDYSKKRESRPGKTYFVRSPGTISEKVKQQKERFLEDLIRARKVGFNSDYLELIRSYFQAITEWESRAKHHE